MGPLLVLLASTAAAAPDLTICADRPSKANGTCTVPVGHWQLEVSGADWTHVRDSGVTVNATSIGQTFVKLGLTDHSDLEVGFTPYVQVRGSGGGVHDHVSGIGDTLVRYKHRLSGADAPVQVGLLPFIKLPTANHDIGNRKVEGGIAVPANFAGPAGITVTVGPEVDALSDGDGHGYHAAVTNLVNLGFAPSDKVALSAEIWNSLNFAPHGTVRQWSADASAAFLPTKRIQLDAGANFGLSRATPDLEIYAGASILF
jgi:hypothetical protein